MPSPEGTVVSGGAQLVTWDAEPGESTFTLKYSLDNGRHWATAKDTVGRAVSKYAGTSVTWQVPRVSTDRPKCRLMLISYGPTRRRVASDRSDVPFAVKVVRLTSPAGGEVLSTGEIHTVTWESGPVKKPVSRTYLACTRDGGATWADLAKLEGNPGQFDWTVPEVTDVASRCRVRVALRGARGKLLGTDTSAGEFSIVPRLISPVSDPATDIDHGSARVSGNFVNPSGYTSTAYFEFGPEPGYGLTTARLSYAAVGPVTISAALNGLSERTPYQFRLVVENSEGTFLGNVRTFRTYAKPVVLATSLDAPTDLHLLGTDLYWLEIYGEAVKRVPTGGGQVSGVATSDMGGNDGNLALDATSVYWADYDTIWKKPRDGGQVTQLATGLQSIREMTLFAESLYVRTDAGIDRIAVSSGSKTRLLSFSDPLAYQFGLLVDSTGIYLGDWTSIGRLGLQGGTVTTLAVNLHEPSGLLLHAGNLYWSDSGSIRRMSANGGPITTVVPGVSAGSLATDGVRLYWTGRLVDSTAAVASAPIEGGVVFIHAVERLTYASGIGALAVDGTSLYWLVGGSLYPLMGSIHKVGKDVL